MQVWVRGGERALTVARGMPWMQAFVNIVAWMILIKINQWLFLVPLKGGRWHITPQKAIYTANWGIICYLPPFMGTKNNHWVKLSKDRWFNVTLWSPCWSLNHSIPFKKRPPGIARSTAINHTLFLPLAALASWILWTYQVYRKEWHEHWKAKERKNFQKKHGAVTSSICLFKAHKWWNKLKQLHTWEIESAVFCCFSGALSTNQSTEMYSNLQVCGCTAHGARCFLCSLFSLPGALSKDSNLAFVLVCLDYT